MARKRINSKFALILLTAVVGTGAAGFVAFKFLRPKENPLKYQQLADQAISAQDWRTAFLNYSRFVQLSPETAENYVKLGDIARLAAATNRDWLLQDKAAWEKALTVDPRHLPALRKLLDLEWELARIQPSPAALTRVRELAERTVAADPADKKAAALIPMATIQGWLRGIDTDATRLDADIAAIKAMVEADPSEADVVGMLCSAYVRKGVEAVRFQRARESAAAFQNAVDTIENAIKVQPENLALHFRAMGLFNELRRADQPSAKAYDEKLAAVTEKARAMAKPDKPLFIEINAEAAQMAAMRENRELAESIWKDLSEKFPENQIVRLSYAEFMSRDPARRMEAIALLEKPLGRDGVTDSSTALGGDRRRQIELATRLRLQSYRLDAAGAAKDEAEKNKLVAAVRADLGKLQQDLPDAPQPLVIQGRAELIEGRQVDAVQSLGRAKTMMERRPERSSEYYDLLIRLADAYTQTRQTGPAKELLRLIISDPTTKNFIPARLQLIRLLAMEGNNEELKREFIETDKIVKSGQGVGGGSREQMEAAMAALSTGISAQQDPEQALKTYRTMPETNKAQRVTKGGMGIGIGQFDDAARVLSDAYGEDPKDVRVAQMLVQALFRGGKTDDAKAFLARARTENPEDVNLRLLQIQLDKGSQADVRKVIEEQIAGMTDEFTRLRANYELAIADNDRPKAMEYLKKAQSLKPEDRWVLDQLFQNALIDRQFDDAEKYISRLTQFNADQAGGNLYRYKLLAAKGQIQDALAVARRLTQDLPQFGQSWLTLGQALTATGDHEQALAAYQQALQRQPNNSEAMRGSIDANYKIGKPEEANRFLTEAVARYPNDPTFREYRLNHELLYGDSDRALEIREKQAEGKDADTGVQAEMGNAYSKVAASRLQRGDLPGAREMNRKATARYLRVLEARPDELNIFSAVVRSAIGSDEPLAAEAALRKSAESSALSSNPQPMLLMCDFYNATGRPEEAEKAVREAVRRGGTTAGPRRAAATILSRMGKIDEAISMIDGIENARTDAALQRFRAEVLIGAGKFTEAERAVRAMLAEKPEDVDLQNLLTVVYVNSKRTDEALKQITVTLARDPRNLLALYYRALLAMQTGGDISGAVRDLQVIRDYGTLTTEMRLLLVNALRMSGQPDAAGRELREALKMDPTNKIVRVELINYLSTQNPPRYDESLKLLEEGMANPAFKDDPEMLLIKSRLLGAKNDTKGAVAAAEQAVVNSRGAPVAFQQYLVALIAAKDFKTVLERTDPILKEPGTKPYWIHISRAVAKKEQKDRDGAIAEFTSAIESAGVANDDEAAGATIGMMATQLGIDDAIKAIAPKIDTEPKFRLMTAMLQQRKNAMKEALATLEPALAKLDTYGETDQTQIARFAGLLLVSPGPQVNYERAAELYRRVLKITPDDVTILNNLAYLISERVSSPDYAEAIKYSTRAVEFLRKQNNIDPLVFDTHGWLLVLNGRVAEGINVLNEAISRRSFMEGHYHLGMAYLRAGFARDALDQLQRAAKLSDMADASADKTYAPRIKLGLKEAEDAVKEQLKTPGAPPAPAGSPSGAPGTPAPAPGSGGR